MINEQPRSKVLILIILILLVSNIVLLAFFITSDNRGKDTRKSKQAYVTDYLEKEVGFDTAQLARYDSLSKQHRDRMHGMYTGVSADRKTILRSLAGANFSDSAINSTAGKIQDQQKIFEVNMLQHIKAIRDICTESQRARFDTGFYKIIGRRADQRKEK